MEGMRSWWLGRSPREQRLLAVMAALLALVFVWLLVLRPLGDALSAARERHGAAVIALGEARSRAAEIARLRGQPAPPQGRLLTALVGESAVAAGFPPGAISEPEPGQARLALEAVRPQAFFGWLAQMEGQGLIVVQLSVRPNSDRTLAAEVTLRKRMG